MSSKFICEVVVYDFAVHSLGRELMCFQCVQQELLFAKNTICWVCVSSLIQDNAV